MRYTSCRQVLDLAKNVGAEVTFLTMYTFLRQMSIFYMRLKWSYFLPKLVWYEYGKKPISSDKYFVGNRVQKKFGFTAFSRLFQIIKATYSTYCLQMRVTFQHASTKDVAQKNHFFMKTKKKIQFTQESLWPFICTLKVTGKKNKSLLLRVLSQPCKYHNLASSNSVILRVLVEGCDSSVQT